MNGAVTGRSVVQIIVRSVVQEITSFITREGCVAVKSRMIARKKARKISVEEQGVLLDMDLV